MKLKFGFAKLNNNNHGNPKSMILLVREGTWKIVKELKQVLICFLFQNNYNEENDNVTILHLITKTQDV